MVEELVRRYQAAQPKRRRWPAVLGCVLACALLLYLFGQLRSVRQDYQDLQQALNNVNYSVGSQIGTISDQVRSLLEQQVNITLSESTDIASVDYAAGTVTFSLSAAPKTYVDGMTAVFTVDCGEEIVSAEGTLGENQCYTASVTCPLTDAEISILAAFVQGDTRQYQLIGQYTGLYSASFPRYDLYDTPLLFAIDTMNSLLRKGEQFSITRWIDEDSLTPSEPAQLRMGLFRDQKLVMWLDPNTDANTDARDSSFFRTPRAVTLEAGHIYTLALVVTDAEAEGAVVRLILKNKSPVAGEHLPSDEVRLLGSEERHGVGDVLGRAESAERCLLRQLRQHLRRERVKHVRPDDARRDAVHADLRRRELRRE